MFQLHLTDVIETGIVKSIKSRNWKGSVTWDMGVVLIGTSRMVAKNELPK